MCNTKGKQMTGIPKIVSYAMPTKDELPRNTAAWTVDPNRVTLLIHDMQQYFIQPFPSEQAPVAELVRNTRLLRELCADRGIPIAYTVQPGGMTEAQRGLLKDFWGVGMTTGPADRAVVEPLTPSAKDWVLTKWRYSAFHKTDLLARMHSSGRDQLIICGVYAHVGVLMTACEAFSSDIQPFLAADAIADFTNEDHRQTLNYAARRCAMVATTEQVLAQLAAVAVP